MILLKIFYLINIKMAKHNDNYSLLKDDRGIRIRMVQSYIKTLNPLDALLKPINRHIQTAQNYLQEQQKDLNNNQEQQQYLNINMHGEPHEEFQEQ